MPKTLPATAVAVVLSMVALVGQGGGGRGGAAGAPPLAGTGQGPGRGGGNGGRGVVPPRDATAQAAVGTASISGVVLVEGAGSPVRRARVNLSGAELRAGRSVITDDQGRFVFSALPAGRFTMTASKAGFVDNTYGAKRAGRPGTQIQLADGQKMDRAVINLPRGGVITGTVLDEHGEPAAGTQVRVLRYVIRTGERVLQQAGQDAADDRGIYRVYQLQPGEYVVNALPRNMSVGDFRQTIVQEVANLTQQMQAQGVNLNAQSFAANFDPAQAAALANALGGRGGPLADRITQLQTQLANMEQEQAVAYAPVYYPGTTEASSAQSITLGVGEERSSVDFRLQLVTTARVSGLVATPTGVLPTGTQVALVPADRGGMPPIPGLSQSSTRVGPDGRFTFNNVTPGRYQLQARATIREQQPAGEASTAVAPGPRGGFGGGAGGPGAGPISQVLWAAAPLEIGGQNPPDTVLNLQPGMTISGRVVFPSSAGDTADPTRVRVSLTPRGQTFEVGGAPAPAQVDGSGRFTIVGVAPGRYSISAGLNGQARGQGPGGRGQGPAPAGRAGGAPATGTNTQWFLESVVADSKDVLDFPIDVQPNQNISNVQIAFTNQRQELSGTIQDGSGRPVSDFTIIVFPPDARYWMPQARRIAASRPGTDGRFTFPSLPPGDYRLTAVTDAEPGEWYDPAFLTQLSAVSIPVSIAAGEKKVQDIRLAQ
jgi:hypothetical protein